MVSLETFSGTEDIAQVLHTQDGLQTLLIRQIADLNLPADQEHLIFALIDAQEQCRRQAVAHAHRIAREKS